MKQMFPALPVAAVFAGFEPDFNGIDEHALGKNWYDMYEYMSQGPHSSILLVSFFSTLCLKKKLRHY